MVARMAHPDLEALEDLARQGNHFAARLVEALEAASDDNERKITIELWTKAVRPVVHAAVNLGQSLGYTAAAANARANAE
jgi:hypothetical protein